MEDGESPGSNTPTGQAKAPSNRPPKSQRGRGRGSNGTSRGRPATGGPTFQSRAAAVASAEGAPAPPSSVAPIPLSQLSAMMDAMYPTSMEHIDPPKPVMIDTAGFCDLASYTYRTIINRDDKLERVLSEDEFILCCGQVLTRRILSIRNFASSTYVPDQQQLTSCIPADTQLPSPITLYLEGLGIIRDVHGQITYPTMVLPRVDIDNTAIERGMNPGREQTDFCFNTELSHFSSMFPFGLLTRRIINMHAGQAPNYNNATSRWNPAQASLVLDPYLARPATLPRCNALLPMHRDRIGKLTTPFSEARGLLPAICYNGELFQQFVMFNDRAQKIMSLTAIPNTTAGTSVLTAVAIAEDGTPDQYPNQFTYYGSTKLTTAEQHAVRMFRYRVQRPRQENCLFANLGDASTSFNYAPECLRLKTMLITSIQDYRSYAGHFIRGFTRPP
jgi:hypothetical protein